MVSSARFPILFPGVPIERMLTGGPFLSLPTSPHALATKLVAFENPYLAKRSSSCHSDYTVQASGEGAKTPRGPACPGDGGLGGVRPLFNMLSEPKQLAGA